MHDDARYTDSHTDKDILLGRPGFNRHPGNAMYRNTVRKFQPRLKTEERTEVAEEIVDHIDEYGGRFLIERREGRWEIMARTDVMNKVLKAVVEMRNNKKNKAANDNDDRSSPKATAVGGASESTKEGEKKTTKSTGRPRRKVSLVRKANENHETAHHRKKKKAKLSGRLPSSSGGGSSQSEQSQRKEVPQREEGSSQKVPVAKAEEEEVRVEREEYVYRDDPNEYYVEETAHVYHNPPLPSDTTSGVSTGELRGIPPPPPLPEFPRTGSCQWSYNDRDRLLVADFSVGAKQLTLEDTRFLFEMKERTDITVVSRGLLNLSRLDPSVWSLGYLKKCVGREFYHKFRRFDRYFDENGFEKYSERDNLYSMRFGDFVEYCEKRESYMKKARNDANNNNDPAGTAEEEEPAFTFEDHLERSHTVRVGTTALYMIDVDMKKLTPMLNKNFLESFELSAVLPGGSHCMMNSVTPDARPFMGPNLYVTPPASFTHFHQDGHGTVDSGHLCIGGYNEVVMLRRLTERHKKHALWILSGKKPSGYHFDGLYSMPHGDGLGEKPTWPNIDMIEECEKMGYCPSVFTLGPGDLVHINKGRLHAFRKMSTSELPEPDCHAERRRNIVESKGMVAGEEKLCVSVAWDWMYRGVTPAGINREVSTILEGSALNRKNNVTSLAIPELALLQMAKCIPARSSSSLPPPPPGGGISSSSSFLGGLLGGGTATKKEEAGKTAVYESTKEEICRGILPGLCIVVGQHTRALNVQENKSTEVGARLSIAKHPDTQENPQICPLDPYGDSDFACKLCFKELSNVYFHCDGCETLLSKDFNICRGCYLQGKYRIRVQMHPSNKKRHATLNHMGDNKFSRQSRCPCKNGPACNYCGFCLGCSCRCHSWFTMRTRLCNAEDEEKLLQAVKDTAAAAVTVASRSATAEGVVVPSIDEEPTKNLHDRLRDAGDNELLNEEDNNKKDDEDNKKKDDNNNDCVNEEEDSSEKMQIDNMKANKNNNRSSAQQQHCVAVKEEEDSSEKMQIDKKDEVKANENNGGSSAQQQHCVAERRNEPTKNLHHRINKDAGDNELLNEDNKKKKDKKKDDNDGVKEEEEYSSEKMQIDNNKDEAKANENKDGSSSTQQQQQEELAGRRNEPTKNLHDRLRDAGGDNELPNEDNKKKKDEDNKKDDNNDGVKEEEEDSEEMQIDNKDEAKANRGSNSTQQHQQEEVAGRRNEPTKNLHYRLKDARGDNELPNEDNKKKKDEDNKKDDNNDGVKEEEDSSEKMQIDEAKANENNDGSSCTQQQQQEVAGRRNEPTKNLHDRLKDAGDNELPNEVNEKDEDNNDDGVKEEDSSDMMQIDEAKANENNDGSSSTQQQQQDVFGRRKESDNKRDLIEEKKENGGIAHEKEVVYGVAV